MSLRRPPSVDNPSRVNRLDAVLYAGAGRWKKGADVAVPWAPLMLDSEYEDLFGVDYPQGKYRETPLMLASRSGDVEEVIRLLRKKANVDLKDRFGWTALMNASEPGHLCIVALLLAFEADVDLQNSDGWTAMIAASRNGKVDVVKLLVNKGADVSIKDHTGSTALWHARNFSIFGSGQDEVAKVLSASGS